ncbi:hypothetical protein [Alicyclobacillus sp. ALC3]|uniref:hypothetical protein n=1 Tax=Alicyclobacillus sp. ALC3 TaxID=2796143 RepID=UPI002379E8EA|nr:hypothetical protein [Alicyclobacillus sp. ALC3]WDL96706.1 hypothetical protein JC200_20780 [Alicyclobacillus sp. ALC3]
MDGDIDTEIFPPTGEDEHRWLGAIDEARRIKPSIPLIGDYGIKIHDEMELAKSLEGGMLYDGT